MRLSFVHVIPPSKSTPNWAQLSNAGSCLDIASIGKPHLLFFSWSKAKIFTQSASCLKKLILEAALEFQISFTGEVKITLNTKCKQYG